MTEKIKKGDFVELEYTGRFKEDNMVFDTTNEAEAKKQGFFDPKMIYGPVIVCIGQKLVLAGLDDSLENTEVSQEKEVTIPAEKAFGKKNAKLLKLMPLSQFKTQNINPFPGLQLNIDGTLATVRSVSGGRIVMDFNHPFAGKEVVYKFKILRLVTDPAEKVRGYLALILSSKEDRIKVKLENNEANIELSKPLPDDFLEEQEKKIIHMIPEIKKVTFVKNLPAPKLN